MYSNKLFRWLNAHTMSSLMGITRVALVGGMIISSQWIDPLVSRLGIVQCSNQHVDRSSSNRSHQCSDHEESLSPCIEPHAPCPVAPETVEAAAGLADSTLDQLTFGDSRSETSHGVTADHCESIRGGLDQPARRFLAGGDFSWQGGAVQWTMKVDPQKQNYLTVKLWGSDKGYQNGRLIVFANGQQLGYRHESDHDVLNQCDDDALAVGRFVYVTVLLPRQLTDHQSKIDLKILSVGPIWFYGSNFEQYQKPFVGPSRGVYCAYTHVMPRMVVDAAEVQGAAPEPTPRVAIGPEVIAKSRAVVIDRLSKLLESKSLPGNQATRCDELYLLGNAYQTSWTPASRNHLVIERIVRIGDAMVADFAKDPKWIDASWSGVGPLGYAVMQTWPDIQSALDAQIDVAGKQVVRRSGWAAMLKYSMDFWRTHRRSYTNQSMIVDAGIYTANRALQLISPDDAITESRALAFLYQSAGIDPWLGRDTLAGGSEMPYGKNYHLITRKGLSRELGYVASYGETILPFIDEMAMLTGDRKLREQARKMQVARLIFRYPSFDAAGGRCMKLASEIDNRTAHYPYAGSAYNAPAIREAWWMETAAMLSDDQAIVGAAQQSIEEGQYYPYIASRLADKDTLGMMRNVSNWEKVSKLPKHHQRLPMTPGQPDVIFADEENAILAIKRGESILFINLYFRAERAVNRVARIFELSPNWLRIATVRTEVEIIHSGESYVRPDWIDRIRNRGITPPGQTIHQAWAGEVMPISKRPDDATQPKYGDWGPFLGKAAFYSLRYGDWLIGMNTTEHQSYSLTVPDGYQTALELVSGKSISLTGGVKVPPLSTVVIDLGNSNKTANQKSN